MKLKLILGPMKSGKSLDLIGHFAPLRFSDISFGLYQPEKNIRDEKIWSRIGIDFESIKIKSLSEIEESLDVIGIDEIHMFPPEDVKYIENLLRKKKTVIVSGLDTDYRGKMFDIVKLLLELGPEEVRHKKAICEICKNTNAAFTQIFDKNGNVVTGGLPSVIPDDGSYIYKPVCLDCFKKENLKQF